MRGMMSASFPQSFASFNFLERNDWGQAGFLCVTHISPQLQDSMCRNGKCELMVGRIIMVTLGKMKCRIERNESAPLLISFVNFTLFRLLACNAEVLLCSSVANVIMNEKARGRAGENQK